MKRTLILIALLTAQLGFSQNITLNLNHEYNGVPFAYGTNFLTEDGKIVSFDRVQYYLSGMTLTHDGGQTLNATNPYVLASGNVTSYDLGAGSVTMIEGIKFDLGVDATANADGTSSWPATHPLGPQSPSMDWGWPAGYFFFVVDGKVDDNGDGVPNKDFQMRGLGDALLANVEFTGTSISGNTIEMYVNIADWVKNLDLPTVGFQHNGSQPNVTLSENTNNETVFTLQSGVTASIGELSEAPNHIYADYNIPYAPTLYYTLNTKSPVEIKVFDQSGKVVLEAQNQPSAGNFFVRKELKTGTYYATFANGELQESFKFIVKQ